MNAKGFTEDYWYDRGYRFADSSIYNSGMQRESIGANEAFDRFWTAQTIEESIDYDVAKIRFFAGITERYTEFRPYA